MFNLHYSVLLSEFINSTLIKYLRIMRKLLFPLFLLPLCTKGQDIPVSLRTFKGNYPKFPIDTVLPFPFINVFERTLEGYYVSGLPTNLIDKEKGIISTGFTPFYRRYTFEQKRKLLSSVAYVVIERDPVYPPSIVMGIFETKLIPLSNSETRKNQMLAMWTTITVLKNSSKFNLQGFSRKTLSKESWKIELFKLLMD